MGREAPKARANTGAAAQAARQVPGGWKWLDIGVNVWLTFGGLVLLALFVWWAKFNLDAYYTRVLNMSAIYVVAAVSYNLINGVAGQFSLGPNGFMSVGAYATALLMLPVSQKEMVWFLQPLVWPLNSFSLPGWLFVVGLIAAGIVGTIGGLIVGIPSLRLRGDYLAIATFGFGEIVFVIANNIIPVTNGALGIKGIPEFTDLWWTAGWAVFTVIVVQNLVNSSFGRALKAIREDETAAEAMGVNVFMHKVLAFGISAFFGGVAGGLLAGLLSSMMPSVFTFFMTFNLLIIIVLGGLGSTTGAVVTAILFTILQEYLRVVEAPIDIAFIHIPGIPGMRMVVVSALLVILMIFWRKGLFGRNEFSWEWLLTRFGLKRGDDKWQNTAMKGS